MNEPVNSGAPESFGRYVLHGAIARGGMATVHTARLVGAEGFSRLVAAKRLHPQFTEDPDFVAMFHDEARIASKIHHPNVVPVLDVVLSGQEVILVQEYVHGVPLHSLFKVALENQVLIPVDITVAILVGILGGLHAAHETTDEMEMPLHIVHRDVSPHNVMVSVDGIPRLLDFGIAKARSSSTVTRAGFFKGKVGYMSPEQLRMEPVTRTADIYACGILLWELLVHRRVHAGRSESELFHAVLRGDIPAITTALGEAREEVTGDRWEQMTELEPIVSRAVAIRPEERYETAEQMLDALLRVCRAATPIEVAHWVRAMGAEYLEERHRILASNEESWRSLSKVRAASAVTPESTVAEQLRTSDAPLQVARQSRAPTSASPITMSAAPEQLVGRPFPLSLGAALLVLVGVLAGVLGVRQLAPQPPVAVGAEAPLPSRPEALVTSPIATIARETPEVRALPASPRPALAAPSTIAVGSVPVERATHATAPPLPLPRIVSPVRPSAPPPPLPARSATPASIAPPATAAASGGSARADCNPPFYFEGTKKLFKPSCL